MTIPSTLDFHLVNSLRNYLDTQLPTVETVVPGIRNPAEVDDARWIEVFPINMPRSTTRRNQATSSGTIQCSCFARFGGVAGQQADMPWILSGEVIDVLSGTDLPILDSDLVQVAIATFSTRVEQEYLAENMVAAAPGSVADLGTEITNLHGVAVTFYYSMIVE